MMIRSEPFSPAPYLSIPNLTARSLMSLCRALDELAPQAEGEASLPNTVKNAHAQLLADAKALEQALVERQRNTPAQLQIEEAELDVACDAGWLDLRDRLRGRTLYARAGFARLAADPDAKIDYAARVEGAQRATELHARIFGAEELTFLRRTYADQATAMAARLKMIDEDGLAADIDELVGPDMLELLRDLQRRYEDMVNARAARREVRPLRVLTGALRESLGYYAVAVIGMVDVGDPSSRETVERSLQPILNFRREAAARARGRSQGEGSEGEEVEGAGEDAGSTGEVPGAGAPELDDAAEGAVEGASEAEVPIEATGA